MAPEIFPSHTLNYFYKDKAMNYSYKKKLILSFAVFLFLVICCSKSKLPEYEELLNERDVDMRVIHVFLKEFNRENAQIILDKYIKDYSDKSYMMIYICFTDRKMDKSFLRKYHELDKVNDGNMHIYTFAKGTQSNRRKIFC